MTRKLLMVGVIVLVGRGTAGQLLIAIVLAVMFLVLHLASWPYKQFADNALKMTIEIQIFCTAAVGLAMKAEADKSASIVGYDVFLVRLSCLMPTFLIRGSKSVSACCMRHCVMRLCPLQVTLFAINVPVAFLLTAFYKLRNARRLLRASDCEQTPERRAYELL